MTEHVGDPPAGGLGLRLVPAFTVDLTLGRPLLAGGTGGRPARAVVAIEAGRVTGPRLSGTVHPGGSEWAHLGAGPRIAFDARYVIEADDGTRILVENFGYRFSTPEVEARLRAGEAISADAYYMVATPRFEVAEGVHDWLTRTVLVGRGERMPGGNRISFSSVENG